MIPILARAILGGSAKGGGSKKAGVEVLGVQELEANMEKLAKKFSQDIVEAAIASGEIVRTEAIESIQEVSRGDDVERYREGGNSYMHTASKVGDAPNTDTGALVRSVQVEVGTKYVYVGSSLDYAKWLEFGTRRMGARPWLNPALERKRNEIRKQFDDRINKTIKLENAK